MKNFRLLFMILVASRLFAWSDVGHEVVAKIAWLKLDEKNQGKIMSLLQLTAPFYEENKSFVTASRWADLIKDGMPAYNNWHYINQPYMVAPFNQMPVVDKVNLVYGLCQTTKTLKQSPREFDKGWMLPMLIHLVGDAHQPLHGATQYTKEKPDGDQGGNRYMIIANGKPTNLHLYWDLGLGLLGNMHAPYNPVKTESPLTEKLTREWTAEFPPAYFKEQIQDINFDNWVRTDLSLAKEVVYQTTENAVPSEAYIATGQKLVKEKVVLAGYRLAYLLEKLLSTQERLDLGCSWTNEMKK